MSDLGKLLEDLDAAHKEWAAGGWPAIGAMLAIGQALPRLTAALRAVEDVLAETDEYEWNGTTHNSRLRATLAAALTSEGGERA